MGETISASGLCIILTLVYNLDSLYIHRISTGKYSKSSKWIIYRNLIQLNFFSCNFKKCDSIFIMGSNSNPVASVLHDLKQHPVFQGIILYFQKCGIQFPWTLSFLVLLRLCACLSFTCAIVSFFTLLYVILFLC